MNGECIFCKIARREIPAKIVYEDEEAIAFLDINPRAKGMCIVIPKQHFMTFNQNKELASRLFDKALIVGEKIKKSLSPLTVFFSIMAAQVPHFHIRVYPVYKDQVPLIENKPLEVTEEELNFLAGKIRSAVVEWKGREGKVVEEKPKEKIKPVEEQKEEMSKEDIDYLKRTMDVG
jgi:histidine triad (HIT) family protein